MDRLTLVLQYILASVLYIGCLAGIITNLFMVAANFLKWKTMKCLPIGDKILSSLATSRSLFLLSQLWAHLPLLYDLRVNIYLQAAIMVITASLHCTNLWFATVLCVFYCVKITSYNWKFFVFLKAKISTLVPWFLLASLLISVFSSLPFYWNRFASHITNDNITLPGAMEYINSLNNFQILIIGSCPPFLVFLVADCLLLHSLWRHTRRMRKSCSNFRCPNLDSHFRVVKSMSFFLVLQILYFGFFVCLPLIIQHSITAFWVGSIGMCGAPFLHSLYIIMSNSELKKTFISMIHVLACFVQS